MYGMTDTRGSEIWDTICYLGCTGETFETKDVQRMLVQHGFKPKTAALYFNRFVRWANANPDKFSGPASKLVRISFGVYRLDNNPER
jgi:hypothetical protein